MSRLGITKRMAVTLATAFAAVLAQAGVALCAQPTCGQVLTSSARLEADLTCPGGAGATALQIGADNVTIDLGGYTLSGAGSGAAVRVTPGMSVSNVKVKNGTITGFRNGIYLISVDGGLIDHVVILDSGRSGIDIRDSSEIVIQNSAVQNPCLDNAGYGISVRSSDQVSIHNVSVTRQLDLQDTIGIALNGVLDADVTGVFVDGFAASLNIWCDGSGGCPLATDIRGNGKVTNSVFSRAGRNGLTMTHAANYTISANHVWGMVDTVTGYGYGLGGGWSGPPLENIAILDNTVAQCDQGITFSQLLSSRVEGNKTLYNSLGGLGFGPGCERNKVEANVSLLNGLDLYNEIGNENNVWEDNICKSVYGYGPECNPRLP